MRIVHVAIRFPPAEGGGEQVVYNLAKEQVKMGNKVYVITTDLMKEVPREVDRNLPKRETIDGINVIRMKTYPTGLPAWGYGSIFFGLKKIIKEINPDIVHTHSYGYFYSDLLARFRKKSEWKLVMTSHGFTPPRTGFKFIKKIYDKTMGCGAAKILDAGIALSKGDKKTFENLGCKKAQIILNGIDYSKFKQLPDGSIFRKRHNIKGRIILSVGRLEYIKGFDVLINAFSKLVLIFPDLKLVIVGADYGEEKNLKGIVKKLYLEKKVLFTGELRGVSVLETYSACDVFVSSSLAYGAPIVVLEAMACGKPIVATDVRGGISDWFPDACLLVEPNNISQLKEGLEQILKDENLGKKLAENGKKMVANFSWEKIAEKVVEVYNNC